MPLEKISVTIAGKAYDVLERYEEGHELTAGEASALNQTLRENIRNNLATKAKEGALSQDDVDKYAHEYEFGVRTGGGGRTTDPVMVEFMRLAKDQIRKALKAQGKSADAEQITNAAKALASHPKGEPIMALARQRVAEAQSVAGDLLSDIIAGIPEKVVADQPSAAA